MIKKSLLFTITAVSVLTLSACGTSGPDSTSNASAPGGKQLTKIMIGAIPVVDFAPAWLGKAKGFFADEGLDITMQSAPGGAAVVEGLVAGTFDFGSVNYVSAMVAREKGLDVKCVANANTVSTKTPDFEGIIVRADSPIKRPADLVGKTVAVNQLNNIVDLTVRGVVADDGGDGANIKFVEVGLPDMAAAVENNQVEAAALPNPFFQAASAAGARIIGYGFQGFDSNLDVAGWCTMGETVKDKPDLVKAFRTAMNKSLDYSEAHPDEVKQIVTTYTKLTADQLKNMTLPRYMVEFHKDALTNLGEAAVKYDVLAKAPDLSQLLLP